MVHKCKICGRIVWFWQDKADVFVKLKNGKRKKIRLCIGCGMRLAEAAGNKDEN
jgi:AMMECR1 domain-containing protein